MTKIHYQNNSKEQIRNLNGHISKEYLNVEIPTRIFNKLKECNVKQIETKPTLFSAVHPVLFCPFFACLNILGYVTEEVSHAL